MKHYKLLKDLPTFKAGDEFELNEKGHLVFVRGTQEVEEGQTLIAYTSYTLEKFPNILKDWFEEMPEQYKRWRAKENGGHYFVDDWGDVDYNYDAGFPPSTFRYNIGNYFKNEEEAEAYKEYLLAKQVLLDDTKGFVPDWKNFTQAKFEVFYDHGEKKFDYLEAGDCQTVGAIYFETEEDIKESFEKHKEQWEIVRRYEMGSR
jgi:hypothetical protein